jgi:uncharacterized protein
MPDADVFHKPEEIAGIDFGSRLAGTTAICYLEKKGLSIIQSKKRQDADLFIIDFIDRYKPGKIFIDAPLSLPSRYRGEGTNYFYRAADREVRAMSPMFIGGLTARAIKLKDTLTDLGIEVFEVYPSHLVKTIFTDNTSIYKKKNTLNDFLKEIINEVPYKLKEIPVNWHQLDSLLAWMSGYRFFHNEHIEFGNPSEGLILV